MNKAYTLINAGTMITGVGGILKAGIKKIGKWTLKDILRESLRSSKTRFLAAAEAIANGAKLLKYRPTSGVMLISTPGKTTTVLGRFADDMGAIIEELQLPKSYDFGAKPNGFNVLNCPDSAYVTADQFWLEYNKPFLEQAVARGDEIIMATKPVGTALRNSDGTLTGLGREYEYLTSPEVGYHYYSILNKMIKN